MIRAVNNLPEARASTFCRGRIADRTRGREVRTLLVATGILAASEAVLVIASLGNIAVLYR